MEVCLFILSNPAAALPPERKQLKDDFEWRTPLHILKPLREVNIESAICTLLCSCTTWILYAEIQTCVTNIQVSDGCHGID